MDICSHDEFCGGCIYQGLPYNEQLKIKEEQVLALLKDRDIQYEEFLGIKESPAQYAYRNKMEYTFGDMVKDGDMTLGMHQKGRFMSIVTVDTCQIVEKDFNYILLATLNFCNEKGYKHYHKKSHKGLLRNLIVRKGERTGELLINIVTSSQVAFDEDGFVDMLKNLEETTLENKIVGVLRTINDGLADAVNCDELRTLWGRDYYYEEIMGLKFKVSAFSFFQTNISAVEKLYTDAIEMIDDFSEKTVFDLFCGTGTISQSMAGKARKVVGVELVEDAVASAKENAKLNGIENCEFICGDVFKVMEELTEKPDVIVVDPPRVGIQPKALEKIINYDVEQIMYISCNPKTLAINLQTFQFRGYKVKKIKAYDNFPMTKHVECVCLLEKV